MEKVAFSLPALRETGREQTERRSEHRTRLMCFCLMIAAFGAPLRVSELLLSEGGPSSPSLDMCPALFPGFPMGHQIFTRLKETGLRVCHTHALPVILPVLCVLIVLQSPRRKTSSAEHRDISFKSQQGSARYTLCSGVSLDHGSRQDPGSTRSHLLVPSAGPGSG